MTDTTLIYKVLRVLVLLSFAGLILWLLVWSLILSPAQALSPFWIAGILILPLLLTLPGLLRGDPYTHAWGSLLYLFYFALGLSEAISSSSHHGAAMVATVLALILFVTAILFPRAAKLRTR
jgi:uncharacterized membrane protein